MAKTKMNEVGLEIGLILGKQLLNTEYLHYGYWTETPTLAGFPAAQIRYADFLAQHIPAGVKTILDVGCGTGKLAAKLAEMGYEIECISPSPFLSRYARSLLPKGVPVHEYYFQDFPIRRTYDLVLFSESFQYIPLDIVLAQSERCLNPNGHILVCDFFKTGATGQSYHSGGHHLDRFYAKVDDLGLRAEVDLDITPYTSPTLDLYNQFLTDTGAPIFHLLLDTCRTNWPWLAKLIEWKFQKKITKMERKYFSGLKSGENFATFKSYRLIVLGRK